MYTKANLMSIRSSFRPSDFVPLREEAEGKFQRWKQPISVLFYFGYVGICLLVPLSTSELASCSLVLQRVPRVALERTSDA